MTNKIEKNYVTVKLSGRIDSENSAETEKKIFAQLADSGSSSVILDAEHLEYISSAGLRVILRVKKIYSDLRIINVRTEVYEILEMTGFTEMMRVEKAYRVVSVEGCEVIGEGFNGKVYRIDRDNVVKTYKNADALAEIQHEREVARLALILGVPTAISYDVVRVGDSYGSVFELLNARSFSNILAKEPERMDFCVAEYVKMLKKIHSITVPEGKLPSIKEKTLKALERMKDRLPDGLGDKLLQMANAVPESNHMVHGDFHTKNIVIADNEVLLIDMDTLSVGHPIFEFLRMYNSYIGYAEYDPEIVLKFQGYDINVAGEFWHKTLEAYFDTKDENKIREIEEKIRCLSYAYLIDWRTRHPGNNSEVENATISLWQNRLTELLRRVDSLEFDINCGEKSDSDELDIEASVNNLQKVIGFINSRLEKVDCPAKKLMQIDLAVEEIFVNIANYAYAPDVGKVSVSVKLSGEPSAAEITFADRGVPYNPLEKEDPDITLSADERQIGGVGIFMTKKIMDEIFYEHRDGQNILILRKRL